MSPVEAAWVAGIIEGEGCFVYDRGYGKIQVNMTDLDVIERLQSLTGVGTILSRTHKNRKHKPFWSWTVNKREDFLALCEAVEPYMLSRRTAKLREVRALVLEHQAGVLARRESRKKVDA